MIKDLFLSLLKIDDAGKAEKAQKRLQVDAEKAILEKKGELDTLEEQLEKEISNNFSGEVSFTKLANLELKIETTKKVYETYVKVYEKYFESKPKF